MTSLTSQTSRAPQTVKEEARALYLRGLKEKAEGRLELAIEFFDAALAAQPDFPEALCSGGYILQSTGHHQGALAFYGRAIELDPDYFDALFNRGCLNFALNRLDLAGADFARAAQLQPTNAGAQGNLAAVLFQTGRLAEAVEVLKKALTLDPALLEAELNLGSVLRRLGRMDEAYRAFMRAALLKPDCAEAYCGLGIVARATGEFARAMDFYNRALAIDPKLEEALSSKGTLQLLLGNFEEGWEGYESRWIDGRRLVPVSDARFDVARPETIAGRRVMVVNDHGLGDTIQFFRYVKLLSDHGADVTFAVPAKMQRLLQTAGANVRWRNTNDFTGDFDATIAISSLPRAFSTVEKTIPTNVPYLAADADKAEFWRARMPGNGFKVGLCWRGSQDFRIDPRRSIPPSALAPLAALPGVELYALHMDVGADELPAQLATKVHVFGDGFDLGADAFVDTAAVMANLDLVVTCDTSIAHLAGAMGRPVWVTLRHHAEWRWMLDREDSPWYPTMRLLRTRAGDDWFELYNRIAGDIAVLTQEKTISQLIEVPVSWGELVDKITILEIKVERIDDPKKLANVTRELGLLNQKLSEVATQVQRPKLHLKEINTRLWDIEDEIRDCERQRNFGPRFIELARAVYITNDLRADLKREINVALSSELVEEKSYRPYA